jgi:hypothetical protein
LSRATAGKPEEALSGVPEYVADHQRKREGENQHQEFQQRGHIAWGAALAAPAKGVVTAALSARGART